MDYRQIPFSRLLQDRRVFAIFDDEFQKAAWLDVTALLRSDGTLESLYEDDTVPREVLDKVLERLRKLGR